jgi:uncharacterized membrane protein YeaQ/YmgE (transglycosylase-associated protein family)
VTTSLVYVVPCRSPTATSTAHPSLLLATWTANEAHDRLQTWSAIRGGTVRDTQIRRECTAREQSSDRTPDRLSDRRTPAYAGRFAVDRAGLVQVARPIEVSGRKIPVHRPGQGPGREKAIVEIIGVLVAGVIIGLLGKFVAPGDRDNIPLWLTVLCGIGGVLIGYYLAAALGVESTKGVDWLRWIISIIVAAILVVIAASVTGRRTGRRV